MKFLTKITAFILIFALLASLTACSGGKGTLEQDDDKAKLTGILDDIAAAKKGTTGGTLNSIRIAADLVSWAASTNMSASEAAANVSQWVKELPEEDKAAFREQLQGVAEAYGKIAVDGAKDLLKEAGKPENTAKITQQLKSIVEAILQSGGIEPVASE